MSLVQALALQADRAYKSKNWKNACNFFDSYFRKAYPDEQTKMSVEDAIRLIKYAQSLFEKLKSEGSGNQKYNQDDLESVASYLISARNILKEAPKDSFPIEHYIDTFDFLGQVALTNNQFKSALEEFSKGYTAAVEANLSWRISLSLLFFKSVAYEQLEKPKESIKVIEEGLKSIEEEVKKQQDESQLELLNVFKKDFEDKIKVLQEDVKEQEENKDTLKEEEGAKSEEEEEEEEEEEHGEDEEGEHEEGKEGEDGEDGEPEEHEEKKAGDDEEKKTGDDEEKKAENDTKEDEKGDEATEDAKKEE